MIHHLVFDGVAEGSLGVGVDVVDTASRLLEAGLIAAPRLARPLRQRVISVDGRPVVSGTGRSISVEGALGASRLRAGDVLVLPGLSGSATGPAAERLITRADAVGAREVLAAAKARGVLIAASCSATFVLAASGLLDGHRATTTWWLVPVFARHFPDVTVCSDRMVVDSDGVLTAGSSFAHADLMLAIIARLTSPALAHLTARYLVLDERASQSRYMVMEHLRSADPSLRALERFVSANLDRQLTIDELAHAVATSPRTLARRLKAGLGMTPLQFVQRLRIAQASHLLETTRLPVDDVAALVGYADAAAFRRVYRRYAGKTPRGRA
jgi:transcriptional regulator GlxA family with amidase domain